MTGSHTPVGTARAVDDPISTPRRGTSGPARIKGSIRKRLDADRYEARLDRLQHLLKQLTTFKNSLGWKEFMASSEARAQVERYMLEAIEICGQLANQLLKALDRDVTEETMLLGPHATDSDPDYPEAPDQKPVSLTDLFLLLARAGVYPDDFSLKMVELASLHRAFYEPAEERDQDLPAHLYKHLKNSLYRLSGFTFFLARFVRPNNADADTRPEIGPDH